MTFSITCDVDLTKGSRIIFMLLHTIDVILHFTIADPVEISFCSVHRINGTAYFRGFGESVSTMSCLSNDFLLYCDFGLMFDYL